MIIVKSKVGDFLKFSECLRQAREKAGLTQKELAEKLNVPPQMINRYENSDTEPRIGFVINIANALSITLDELMKTGKSAPINSLLGIDEFTATTEEGRQKAAEACTKLLAPDFKVEYQNGYFVVTACKIFEGGAKIYTLTGEVNSEIKEGETLKINYDTFIHWLAEIGKIIDIQQQEEKKEKFKTALSELLIFEHVVKCFNKDITANQILQQFISHLRETNNSDI